MSNKKGEMMPKKETTKTENTTEFLECKFTEEEMKQHAGDLARKVKEKTQAELKKKEVVATLGAEIAAIETQAQKLSQYITDGYRYGEVKCTTTFDYEHGRVTVIRHDTNEQVKERAMTDDEAQLGFNIK